MSFTDNVKDTKDIDNAKNTKDMKEVKEAVLEISNCLAMSTWLAMKKFKKRVEQSKLDIKCNILGLPIRFCVGAEDAEDDTKNGESDKSDKKDVSSPSKLSKENTFSELSDIEESLGLLQRTAKKLLSPDSDTDIDAETDTEDIQPELQSDGTQSESEPDKDLITDSGVIPCHD